jgi:2-polyprenyl-6-methoxyphenol hydroxylase-like FAD-dependent oxidoreductase
MGLGGTPSRILSGPALEQKEAIMTDSTPVHAGTPSAAVRPVRCVVAGGSLVGLSSAIALSRLGMEVTVLEQSPATAVDGGGGLGIDTALLRQVTGIREEPPALHGVDRDTTAWHLLQAWLEGYAVRRPGVRVRRGTQVSAVHTGNDQQPAIVTAADGGEYTADLVIGADGARSTVRAAVDPDFPDARYAGVLLWRSMVDEQAMPGGVELPDAREPSREIYAGPYRLVTYLVPGAAGQTRVGHRRLNMVWYDPEQGDLLRDMGLLDGETVWGSLVPGALPPLVREHLNCFAAANWPSPWREALLLALHNGTVFGTPIVHYEPKRLARGRSVLAGDAAHAASPMVGGGFRQGLYDVRALTRVMTRLAPGGVPGALARYEQERLGPAARHVAISEQATAAYLAHTGARSAL